MCMGKPKIPAAPAARQAAKAPNMQAQGATLTDQLLRRIGTSATILSGGQLGAPTTAGKTLLGQ